MNRKSLFFIVAAAAVMIGCSKENVSEVPAGIPMTINVSIENTATKTSYTPDGGALKVAWEAGDQISIVSFGSDDVAKTCDTFTTTDGGSMASFTGTYTGADDAKLIKVFYPALTTTGTISDVTGWATPSVPGMYSSIPRFVISNTKEYCRASLGYVNQLDDDDPSHLKYYDSMSAKVASIDELADVTLIKHSTVIKMVINTSNIPAGTLIKGVQIKNSENKATFRVSDWGYPYQDNDFARSGVTHQNADIYLGNNETGKGGYDYVSGITKAADDNTLVAYIPILSSATLKAGDTFTINVGTGSSGTLKFSKTVTLASDIVIPMGSCYTISATVGE